VIIDGYTRYAGFWRRAAAVVMDSFLFGIAVSALMLMVYGPGYFRSMGDPQASFVSYGMVDIVVDYGLPLVLTVFFWTRLGGTPGKLLFGCVVVDARTGNKITVRKALIRYLGYFVSALPLGLGFLWVAWDKQKRGFHDRLANTRVVIEDEAAKTLEELSEACW
jgi:uncharacterized RDD family membrane protein YckC